MGIFGIIAVLIVILIASTTGFGDGWQSKSADTEVEPETQGLAILDDARTAARQLEGGSRGVTVAIYDGVSVSSAETILNLSGRGLEGSLKAEIRMVSGLREIDLSNNKFTGLPAEIGQLAELRVLNLANNPITGLPQEIGNLKKLQSLDLRGTNYSQQDLEIIKRGLPATVVIQTD